MNDPTENRDLLADVLAEASPSDFREALLGETLRLARRRRRFRQAQRVIRCVAVGALLAILVDRHLLEQRTASHPSRQDAASGNYRLVTTQPLPDSAIVSTRPFAEDGLVSSTPSVAQVTTRKGEFDSINDNELLALLAPKPVILIRTGPQSEELAFANLEDQKRFPENR